MELILAPMTVMIAQPWVAGVIGVALLVAGMRRDVRQARMAAAGWIGYCAWEYGMKARLLCSGECNIRVDLLLIAPVLAITTFVAVWRIWRAIGEARPA